MDRSAPEREVDPPALALLVPVLRRPHRVAPLLRSVWAATPPPYTVWFIVDPDDIEERTALREVERWPFAKDRYEVFACGGNYAHKVNAATRRTDAPLLFLAADDVHFHPGWLQAARERLSDGVGVVGTNDLCNPRVLEGTHSTHSLVTREYVERGSIDDPSKLLHEGYPHEFVDDEFIETAKARDAFVFAKDSVVEHLHPMVGKAPMDEVYAGQRQRMKRGRVLYRRREHLWKPPSA